VVIEEHKQNTYRIYVEDCGSDSLNEVTEAVGCYVEAYTVLRGVGCWEGCREDTFVIEIHSPTNNDLDAEITLEAEITALALDLKHIFGQGAVLVTRHTTHGFFV
jgi:hypothetical protein